MEGRVQGTNDQDSTFNLDVRQHATPHSILPPSISPGQPAGADDLWAPGTAVFYSSGQYGWLPGHVTGFNQQDATYNLDIREHADIEKMRARIGDGSPPTNDHV